MVVDKEECKRHLLTEEERQWLQALWDKLEKKLSAECDRIADGIPYIAENGVYEDYSDKKLGWWTNGFWPGILWLMYEATGEEKYADTARKVEDKLAVTLAEFEACDHDLGFRWLHSAVADYRMTGDPVAKKRGLQAATLLAGRFNPIGGYIRAWDMPERITWMIIDCMMNIPLLYWASEESGDRRFREIAVLHADTSMKALLRPDGSSNHVGIMDPQTGDGVEFPGGQGYESGSSWSRGQAWAIYGFALSYRHTGNQEYLETAKRAAHYFISNVALSGFVPKVDFRAPKEPEMYDTTAGMAAACGLLEIAQWVPELEKELYVQAAVHLLKAVEENHSDWDQERDSIVQDGTVMYTKQIHVPIIYGDFFLLEAVRKLMGSEFLIW